MTTHLDTPFAKVWVDEAIPCVFSKIIKPMDKFQLAALIENEMRCVKKLRKQNKEAYSLVDLSDCSILSEEMIIQYILTTVHSQFSSGITYKSFLSSKDRMLNASIVYTLRQFENLKIDIVKSFEEAMEAINRQRINTIYNKPRKSIFSFVTKKLASVWIFAGIGRPAVVPRDRTTF